MQLTTVAQRTCKECVFFHALTSTTYFLQLIVKDCFFHLCCNFVRMLPICLRLNLTGKVVTTYKLCNKIVANSQNRILKPRNVYKCMVKEVMAYPNKEKYFT